MDTCVLMMCPEYDKESTGEGVPIPRDGFLLFSLSMCVLGERYPMESVLSYLYVAPEY